LGKHGLGGRANSAAVAVFAFLLVFTGLTPRVATAAADPSDVVLVLDFSASILRDKANRDRFAAALERIATRVDATAADLLAGDTTVSIVQFATKAADVPGCVELKLLESAGAVGKLADCLRTVATAYRAGPRPAITTRVGTDTNYVAAMERAARHLPAASLRPALILFTDGRHDVPGVPVGRVQPARDRLFAARTPFALLPVGMGLAAADRRVLTTGLERLRITRDMPACVSGATFDWPTVVFDSADEAGEAVAVALQEATCTFTVPPSATPDPTPTPSATPVVTAIREPQLTPGDGKVDLTWTPGVTPEGSVTDYQARCRAGAGAWITSGEGVSLAPRATVEGLTNGTTYECEVAALGSSGDPTWMPAGSVTPAGRPAPPAKPTIEALNGAVRVAVAPDAGVKRIRYECSNDNGASWSQRIDTSADDPAEQIDGLANGTSYQCRAYAMNDVGTSDVSPVSDSVTPCGGFVDCNSLFLPLAGGLSALLLGGILLALFSLYNGRTTGYVIAVVDVVHTANIGHGTTLGLSFEMDASRRVTGIVTDKGRNADVRIRPRRNGIFVVRDRVGRREVAAGDPVIVADSVGVKHSLVLRSFATKAASQVATRR
jgi:hypothetical protein